MRTLAVCCGTPLVGTLIFPKAEYFCTVCRRPYGMFSAPGRVKETPGMLALHEKVEKQFRAIAKDCIPNGVHRIDCPKCFGNETHIEHATRDEIAASDAAYKALLRPE